VAARVGDARDHPVGAAVSRVLGRDEPTPEDKAEVAHHRALAHCRTTRRTVAVGEYHEVERPVRALARLQGHGPGGVVLGSVVDRHAAVIRGGWHLAAEMTVQVRPVHGSQGEGGIAQPAPRVIVALTADVPGGGDLAAGKGLRQQLPGDHLLEHLHRGNHACSLIDQLSRGAFVNLDVMARPRQLHGGGASRN
jgi:hypothetical protein